LTVIRTAEDVLDVGGRTENSNASISVESRGHTTVLTVTGDVDATKSGFMATVLRGFTARSGRIVVDVSGSDLYGGAPLRALADCDRRARHAGAAFVVVTSPMQQALLRRVDSSGTLRTATSVNAAVKLSQRDISPRREADRVDPQKLRC
jgi:anti-anti-sigma regulatory factor